MSRERFDDLAGKLCKALIPIKDEYYFGTGKTVAVCTLSSLELLRQISSIPDLMKRLLIVGRLLSENKGIDAIITFHSQHPELKLIILCGIEVKGHKAGQALVALGNNGVDSAGRIIGAKAPRPVLASDPKDIAVFRSTVRILDYIGTTDVGIISNLISDDRG